MSDLPETPIEPAAAEAPAAPVTPIESTTPVVPIEPQASKEPVAPTATREPVIPITEDFKYSEGAKFNGQDVEVVIPSDLLNYAAEKDVDIQAISKELYASEDFSLSEDSMKDLYKAFGKWQVDTYLSGIKASNENMFTKQTADAEARSVAEKEAWDATMTIMGGEDRWDDLSSYASTNLTEAELNDFNEVMDKGSLKMQQLMISDLYGKFTEAGAPVAPAVLTLEEGASGGDPAKGGEALTSAQFLEIITSGKYHEDPKRYDALRRAGMAKGI